MKMCVGIYTVPSMHTRVIGIFPTQTAGEKYVCEKYLSFESLERHLEGEMRIVAKEYFKNSRYDKIIRMANSLTPARITFVQAEVFNE